MTDEIGTNIYRYDDNNRLLEIKKDGLVQISYSYDENGNIKTVKDRLVVAPPCGLISRKLWLNS